MEKYDYYLHKSEGCDYWDNIGEPKKVNKGAYNTALRKGYRATRVPSGSCIKVVLLQSLIDDFTHPTSHSAKELFKKYCPEESTWEI